MSTAPDHAPYRLLGTSGKLRLQQRLDAAMRRWLDTWNAKDAVHGAVRLADADERAPQVRELHAESYRVRTGNVPLLDIRYYPSALSAAVGLSIARFCSAPSSGAAAAGTRLRGGLVGRFANAVLRGFVNELMDSVSIGEWDLEEIAKSAAPAAQRSARGSAMVQRALVIVGDRELAALELSPQLVNALVPAGTSMLAGSLLPCRGAIGDARVRIDAILGTVELSVADVVSLSPGDVVVLDARLGDCCRLNVPSAAVVAEAVIGKQGDARAVQIRRTDPGRVPH